MGVDCCFSFVPSISGLSFPKAGSWKGFLTAGTACPDLAVVASALCSVSRLVLLLGRLVLLFKFGTGIPVAFIIWGTSRLSVCCGGCPDCCWFGLFICIEEADGNCAIPGGTIPGCWGRIGLRGG